MLNLEREQRPLMLLLTQPTQQHHHHHHHHTYANQLVSSSLHEIYTPISDELNN